MLFGNIMKFTQFLIERISMSHYNDVIEDGVIQCCKQVIDSVRSLKKQISPDARNSADDGKLNTLVNEMTELMLPKCNSIFRIGMARHINNNVSEVKKQVTIFFKPIDPDNGLANGYTITINVKFVNSIVTTLIRLMANIASKSDDKFNTFFNVTGDDIEDRFDMSQIPSLEDMVQVFVHELVHVVQHLKQSHRDTTEYRSYLTNDKKRFNDAIASSSDEDAHLYYASPQEIPAFAHDIVSNILKSMQGKNVSRSDIQDAVRDRVGAMFPNRNDPKVKKVYNRYLKLVYQELMDNLGK